MSVKKMPDGRWYAYLRYKDYAGNIKQHKKTGFPTKREAQEYEAQYKRRMNGATDMTFGEVYKLYLEDKKNRVKPTTYYNIQFTIGPYALKAFENTPITQIDSPMILKWQAELAEQFKSSTVNGIMRRTSEVMKFAMRHYNLQANPFKKVDSLKCSKSEMSIWTVDEFKKASQYIKNHRSTEAYVLTALLFWTGLRIGEALALTPNDIDFSTPSISITKTTTSMGVMSTPKTPKSKRTVLLTKEIAALLESYVTAIFNLEPTDFIFSSSLRRSLALDLNKAAKAAGVSQIRVHDLRHSHASMLINANVPPMLIAERLGHENVTTTLNVYAHLYPNKQSEVIDRLAPLENGVFK